MSERTIDGDRVRDEHLVELSQGAHWAYVFGVLGGGGLLMLLLIAWLGG